MVKVSEKPIIKLLASWEEAAGKTLQSVDEEAPGYKDYLVFRFTDGTALILPPDYGEDNYGYRNTPELFDDGYSDDRRALVFFGLASLEEYERQEARRAAEERDRQHDAELMQYERLKRKFGGA